MSLMMNQAHIDQLPIEIMSNIFLRAIQPLRPRHHRVTSALAKLASISAVSKRWRSVVDAAPELWSFLHSSDPIKITRMAVEKSRDASLTVTCIQYKYPKSDKDLVATRFIDCVKPHVARWRFAFFRVTSTALRRIPGAAAPRLRSFTVQFRDDYYLLDNPFGGQAPQLRELVCLQAALGWHSSPLLTGLSSLKIVLAQKERLFIRCSELYAAIANCPNLQSLVITQSNQQHDDPLFLGDVPVLHLPYLTEIKLSVPPAFANAILAHIQAPACNIFMAEAEVGLPEVMNRLLPYLSGVIKNRPLENWKTEIFVEEERVRFTLAPVHKTFTVWRPFDLEFSGVWIPTFSWIIEKLLPSVPTQHPMTLHFSIGCEYSEDMLEPIFLRLSHPIEKSTGAPQWIFPKLRKVEIYGAKHDWDVLVETVRSRWGRDQDEESDRPEPLETLRFIAGDLTEEQMDHLEEIVGSETVTTEYSDYGTDSAESERRADLLL
ncbi:hypothetical protein FRC01_005653 [Tulasnella sp. 417]|nr:hypothetical protein FRC01_005653 [Tulasnella sp. 417]